MLNNLATYFATYFYNLVLLLLQGDCKYKWEEVELNDGKQDSQLTDRQYGVGFLLPALWNDAMKPFELQEHTISHPRQCTMIN